MPTPVKVTPERLRAASREILDREGTTGLTMQAVARALGVRAPSLYKHVRDRDDLVRLVAEAVAGELGARLEEVAASVADPRARAIALAGATREFARRGPYAYALLFGGGPEAARPGRQALERASAPVLDVARELAGAGRALEAARALTAFTHGFAAIELAGGFRLGPGVDEAWEYGLVHLVDGIAAG